MIYIYRLLLHSLDKHKKLQQQQDGQAGAEKCSSYVHLLPKHCINTGPSYTKSNICIL